MSFDWKHLLENVAPIATTMLGGPFAGAATKLLIGAFDKDGKTDPNDPAQVDKLMQSVVMDPANMVKLKEIEANLAAHMAELGYADAEAIRQANIESERIAANDRNSARARQVSVKDYTPTILAYAITLGFFGLLWFMLKHDVPPANKDILNIMLGSLGSAWIGVVTYYFGSSAGSDKKTALLAQAQPIVPLNVKDAA